MNTRGASWRGAAAAGRCSSARRHGDGVGLCAPVKVLLSRSSMTRLEAPDQSAGRVPVRSLFDRSSSFRAGMLAIAAAATSASPI